MFLFKLYKLNLNNFDINQYDQWYPILVHCLYFKVTRNINVCRFLIKQACMHQRIRSFNKILIWCLASFKILVHTTQMLIVYISLVCLISYCWSQYTLYNFIFWWSLNWMILLISWFGSVIRDFRRARAVYIFPSPCAEYHLPCLLYLFLREKT